ncbi:MAG TPA: recombination regulator RecX [Thauera sp.]|uniref:recombination regulator RecX n=1 Tax=Thauera sp. TaxID=1905334 RepID=UPI002B5D0768|nr:recombination regulator RecX [Thauera sp.]HRP22392.1 recombination regulator RecX [Thauera sp.]HRP65306.1 recombination regulator RecX [Thauera sp.]
MAVPSLRERALRHLARRDHSRAELARKLAAHGESDEVDAVITRMGELGLQSDSRYAEAFVRGKAARFGSSRLRSELARRGIERDLIEQAIASECVESELERARQVLRSRFSCAPADPREWARQARFLQTRGFAPELIRKLLKEPFDESA